MTTFLITISFLLHAVSLFALILLYQRQNNIKLTEQKMRQTALETEEMMTAFLMELKEENEHLLKQLSNKPPEQKEIVPLPEEMKQDAVPLPPIVPRKAAAKAYTRIKNDQEKPVTVRSPAEQMIELKKQGFSDEDIARKMQIGITEVQLGLKLYRPQEK
ncbi:hypothetical protein BTO30_07500 [Domibacillus antri]|uniref:Swarming motility protein SwrB n=1 Tax=Domibacillus antri TaxID=1714264 RepID=A0A1Q8Q5Z3_9BACI|nr:hypothetical protein [Domibacillus antri]OLN22766.1 hypothetical protein BTO30_07500 [Domibacillus antri]